MNANLKHLIGDNITRQVMQRIEANTELMASRPMIHAIESSANTLSSIPMPTLQTPSQALSATQSQSSGARMTGVWSNALRGYGRAREATTASAGPHFAAIAPPNAELREFADRVDRALAKFGELLANHCRRDVADEVCKTVGQRFETQLALRFGEVVAEFGRLRDENQCLRDELAELKRERQLVADVRKMLADERLFWEPKMVAIEQMVTKLADRQLVERNHNYVIDNNREIMREFVAKLEQTIGAEFDKCIANLANSLAEEMGAKAIEAKVNEFIRFNNSCHCDHCSSVAIEWFDDIV